MLHQIHLPNTANNALDVSHITDSAIHQTMNIVIMIVRLAQFQCIAPLAANNLQSGLSSASLVASSTLRLWDKLFYIVASQGFEDVLPAFSSHSEELR